MVAVRARPLAVVIVLLVRQSSSIERSVVMCDTTERCVGDTNAVYMLMFRHADRGSMDGCGVRELVESEETTREQVVTITFVCPHTERRRPQHTREHAHVTRHTQTRLTHRSPHRGTGHTGAASTYTRIRLAALRRLHITQHTTRAHSHKR